MNSEIELDKLISLINNNNKIAIFTHESPDGDAIGSSLALYMGLKGLKKEVDIITDEYPDSFKFLDSINEILPKAKKGYDVCIALDVQKKEEYLIQLKPSKKQRIQYQQIIMQVTPFLQNVIMQKIKAQQLAKHLLKYLKN